MALLGTGADKTSPPSRSRHARIPGVLNGRVAPVHCQQDSGDERCRARGQEQRRAGDVDRVAPAATGVRSRTRWTFVASARARAVCSVTMKPGAIAFTRTLPPPLSLHDSTRPTHRGQLLPLILAPDIEPKALMLAFFLDALDRSRCGDGVPNDHRPDEGG